MSPPPLDELRHRAARACAEWAARGIVVPEADLVAYVAERAASVPEAMRARLRVADLGLACAWSRRDPGALGHFEREYLPALRRALARMSLPGSIEDDVIAVIRERLFAPSKEAVPLIASYSGRGELVRWLRSIAVNSALKALRDYHRYVELDPDNAERIDAVPIADQELAYLRGVGNAAFQRAMRESFQALDKRQRNLLRLYFLDGVTLEALGRMHAIHASTVWRRIEAARRALVDGVRARLGAALGLSESGVDSVVRSAYCQTSILSLLRLTPDPQAEHA